MQLTRPPSLRVWTAWHVLIATLVILVPSRFKYGVPAWFLSERDLTFLLGLATTYLLAAGIVTVRTRRGTSVRLADTIVTSLGVLGIFFLFLLITESSYSRFVLLAAVVLAVPSSVLPFILTGTRRVSTAFVGAVLVALVSMRPTGDAPPENRIATTALANLRVTFHRGHFQGPAIPGGGLATFGAGYLIATGIGELYVVSRDAESGRLTPQALPHRIPLNRDAFLADSVEGVVTDWFRVADILVQQREGGFRLFASHHHWKADEDCFVLRVSAAESDEASFLTAQSDLTWQTIFESTPCLPFKSQGSPFAGNQAGGRLALLDEERLLLTVGDHRFDGVGAARDLPQDVTASYGKIVLIEVGTRATSQYSMGHRNPQGLYVSRNGTIWSTEHGPEGGDELNVILQGANYGWPLATHGTEYGGFVWPFGAEHGGAEGFEPPFYTWVPSIGVSNLVAIEGDLFDFWRDDLLISSLKRKSLWRLRIRNGLVAYVEPIPIGERIRDIIEDQDGRIVLWTDAQSIVIVEPMNETAPGITMTPVIRGALLYAACAGCHQLEDGTMHGIGPDLGGVFERRIAHAEGYSYSGGLKALTGRWSRERLDAFLADPQAFVPGTSMQFEGIAEAAARADLISYLMTRR